MSQNDQTSLVLKLLLLLWLSNTERKEGIYSKPEKEVWFWCLAGYISGLGWDYSEQPKVVPTVRHLSTQFALTHFILFYFILLLFTPPGRTD